ncbi:DNA-binding protein [Paenibacillaceae sp. P-4]|uniref:DNA-binding protein n=1 Tax=Paenibacillaceae bacterium P-4 TaxID=3160969 RepID=UPI0032E8316C
MKQLNLSAIICSFLVGLSLVVSSVIISQSSDREVMKYGSRHKPLLTIGEAAEYLHITESQVRAIISSEELMLRNGVDTSRLLFPIVRIGTDNFISTDGLQEWLKEPLKHRLQY